MHVISQRTAIDETIFPAKAQRGAVLATVGLIVSLCCQIACGIEKLFNYQD